MALENVDSFQYLMYESKIWPWKKKKKEKTEGPQFFNTGVPNGPWKFWFILTPDTVDTFPGIVLIYTTFFLFMSKNFYHTKLSLHNTPYDLWFERWVEL